MEPKPPGQGSYERMPGSDACRAPAFAVQCARNRTIYYCAEARRIAIDAPDSTPVAAPPAESPPLTLYVVSHTHWDREWYLPFQLFRVKLVRLDR